MEMGVNTPINIVCDTCKKPFVIFSAQNGECPSCKRAYFFAEMRQLDLTKSGIFSIMQFGWCEI